MKVSAGCDNCYAETLMDTRYHRVAWGQRKTETTEPSVGTRVRTSVQNWNLPRRWNKAALDGFKKHRVFCSSLADVFDNQVPTEWRTDLWKLIYDTPHLTWLLLTKRPENIAGMLPESWPWPNVWLGVTAEDQENYDRRWPLLQRIPAVVRFISYEPAIGQLQLFGDAPYPDWFICGGESGGGFRPMDPNWARQVRSGCKYHELAFFMKQMAGRAAIPDDLMIREFPQ
jgi:protein gp37